MGKQTAYHFFLRHAGYCYRPGETPMQGRIRCAQRLARAERWARADDSLEFVWEEDEDISVDDFEFEADKEHVRLDGARGCILYRKCEKHGTECKHAEHLASLWGITESLDNRERDNYRRVVEAELALEAMPEEA